MSDPVSTPSLREGAEFDLRGNGRWRIDKIHTIRHGEQVVVMVGVGQKARMTLRADEAETLIERLGQ